MSLGSLRALDATVTLDVPEENLNQPDDRLEPLSQDDIRARLVSLGGIGSTTVDSASDTDLWFRGTSFGAIACSARPRGASKA